MENCCQPVKDSDEKGFWKGLLYGLMPHTFCIAFIVFSIIGATAATAIFKKVLLIPYFFNVLIGLSFVFATISAIIYLKRIKCLCAQGIKSKWKYITTMYATTILINLLIFFVIFPALANINSGKIIDNAQLASLSLKVDIPCSGHAPLIIDELKKDSGVNAVKFTMINNFEIQYDPEKTSPEKITSLEIFKEYKAVIQ